MCVVDVKVDEAVLREVLEDGVAVDLETFRADLHKMIEEVYAEPSMAISSPSSMPATRRI